MNNETEQHPKHRIQDNGNRFMLFAIAACLGLVFAMNVANQWILHFRNKQQIKEAVRDVLLELRLAEETK